MDNLLLQEIKIYAKNAESIESLAEYFGKSVKEMEKVLNKYNISLSKPSAVEKNRKEAFRIIESNEYLTKREVINKMLSVLDIPIELCETYYNFLNPSTTKKVKSAKLSQGSLFEIAQKVKKNAEIDKERTRSSKDEMMELTRRTIKFLSNKKNYNATFEELASRLDCPVKNAYSAVTYAHSIKTPNFTKNTSAYSIVKSFIDKSNKKLDAVEIAINTGVSLFTVNAIIRRYDLNASLIRTSKTTKISSVFNKYAESLNSIENF